MLYADDMLIPAKNTSKIEKMKIQLSEEVKMKHLGPSKKILEVNSKRQEAGKLLLSQKKHIEKILQCFNIKDAKFVSIHIATHFKLSTTL